MYVWQRIWKFTCPGPGWQLKGYLETGDRNGLAGCPVAVWTDCPGFASSSGSFTQAGAGLVCRPEGKPPGVRGSQ